MTEADFAREFACEGDHVELKQGVSSTRIQDASVAFSNTDGGVYIVGVAPTGQIVGVSNPGEKAKDIHQALRDARNPGRYDVHELVVGATTVLVLAVARRHEVSPRHRAVRSSFDVLQATLLCSETISRASSRDERSSISS